MAKFCSNCGKELKENADICLKCGVLVNNKNGNSNSSDVKKKRFPIWAIILIVVGCIVVIPLLILFLVGIFAYNTVRSIPTERIDDYVEEFRDGFEDGVRDYIEEYNENTAIKGEGTVGDTLEIDDMEFTLTKTEMYSSIGDDTHGNIPDLGNKYLILFFDVKNNSDSEKLVTYLNFSGIVDDDNIMSSFLLEKIDGLNGLNRNVKPGEKISGYVAFEVDEDYQNFEVHYQRFVTNNEIIFNISNTVEENEEV